MAGELTDNTSALERATEAQKEGAKSIEELARAIHERQQSGPQLPVGPPPPPSNPIAPTTPPPQAPLAKWMNAAEVQQYQRLHPQPPPIPPHVAMFNRSMQAALEQMQELQKLKGLGVDPKSPMAKPFQSALAAHQEFLGNQWGSLSSQEQKQATPALQALEQQRKEVEEEELKRRRLLNREMERETYYWSLAGRMHQLQGGASRGLGGIAVQAIGQMGPIGQVGKSVLESLDIVRNMMREYSDVLNPGLGQTRDIYKSLIKGAIGKRTGTEKAERAAAYEEQLHAKYDLEVARRRPEAQNMDVLNRARIAINEAQTEGFKNMLRRMGVPEEQLKFKEDIKLPAQPGFTTNLGFQSELQVGALQREDATNELLRQQLEELRRQGALLDEVKQNTNGLDQMNPRWSPS